MPYSHLLRHKALTVQQPTCNRTRSRIRARVNMCSIVRSLGHRDGIKLISTIGLARARATIGLKNLTDNFQRLLILTIPRTVYEV